jgi:hypothetical protein
MARSRLHDDNLSCWSTSTVDIWLIIEHKSDAALSDVNNQVS